MFITFFLSSKNIRALLIPVFVVVKEYKNERKNMIHKIRNAMDYKGEVSDDEDSIIKYDETQDQLSDEMIKYNRNSIKVEEKPNIINEDKPMIDNDELLTGKVESEEISEEIIERPKKQPKSECKSKVIINPIALNNRFLDNRLYYHNVYMRNQDILSKNKSGSGYLSIFGNSESNLMNANNSLFPQQNDNKLYTSTYYNVKKK